MKWNCELIQDLLPLWEEGLCSPASSQAVREHLKECEACRRLTAPLPIEELPQPSGADKAVSKGIRTVRRRWLLSLIAALLVFPLLLLSVNQFQGTGPCFSNLDDIHTARRFLRALETGDWATAAEMHDFSSDYESILEALSLDVSAWSVNCSAFDLLGHDYAAHATLTPPATLDELYGLLYNDHISAMLPPALWQQLMALDPGAFQRSGENYWLNGSLYCPITTPWGSFIASEGRTFATAREYCVYYSLLPAPIYQEAKPDLEAEALKIYTATHQDIGWVADLTEAEFIREMRSRYTAELEVLDGVAAFDCTGYLHSGRRGSSGWYVTFSLTVTLKGKSINAQIQVDVQDGKIQAASLSHREDTPWLDAVSRILYPSAHPGY